MFESAELGHKVSKEQYKKDAPRLRQELLTKQFELINGKQFSVLILISGIEGAGKGETVNLLNEWLDPRHVQTHGFLMPRPDELERPAMSRYWEALPAKGKIGVFLGNWYTEPITRRVTGELSKVELDRAVTDIVRLERMLAAEDVLLVKFWFHLSKAQQKRRLQTLEADPEQRGRVTKRDWEAFRLYDRFRAVAQHALRLTDRGEAPWTVVEGADAEYRNLTVANTLLAALADRLARKERAATCGPDRTPPLARPVDERNVLTSLDYGRKLSRGRYDREKNRWQARLAALTLKPKFARRSVVLVFEGFDAAGKGGGIRRVTQAVDARIYKVVPIQAPTDEESARPYLWRFWRHLPRRGRITIFDRSWYGRVMVERIEGFCSESDWMRAYSEINDFEHQLVEHGVVVVKFFLAITKDEQLRRFREREQTPFKRFKITAEDWRNRKKWTRYEHAVCDMVDRTSTDAAPWTLVEANDKLFARVKVLRTVCEAIERAL